MDDEGYLTTDLYVKPTDTHQYLHKDRCNPSHCKRGIPYSQALMKIRRICSRTKDCLRRTQELKGYLTNRGYHEDEIRQQIDRTIGLDRDTLLRLKRTKTPLERVPIIVTYHPGLPPLRSNLEKHSSILRVSERLKRFAEKNPPLVAYRRPPNPKNFVGAGNINFKQKHQLSYKGNSGCQQTHCKTCNHIKQINRFKSSAIRKMYSIKASANCKTTNVISVIECTKCNKQYVRETENALHIRTNGH